MTKKVLYFGMFCFVLVFSSIIVSCKDSSSDNTITLNGTTWKTSFTENVGGTQETYDVILSFISATAVNFTDKSSQPSNENGTYIVTDNAVTINISNMGITNKTGIIENNILTIDLGMGVMNFIKL